MLMRRNIVHTCLLAVAFSLPLACGDDVGPIKITASNFEVTIAENPNNGTVLGTIEAEANRGNMTFALQTPANFTGAMALNATTGELTVADWSFFDFETYPTITGEVTITNGQVEKTVSVTITLTDVFELTISMSNASFMIAENPTAGQILGTPGVTTNSPEATKTFSIVPADGFIAINATTGELSIATGLYGSGETLKSKASYFNYELHPTVTATFAVTIGNHTQSAIVTVTLTDVTETIQQRLDDGETPKQMYDKGVTLPDLLGKTYAGGTIAYFNTSTGAGLVITDALNSGAAYTQSQAANAANDLVLNGYNDWHLPSETEANSMCGSLSTVNNLFSPAGVSYWGSSFCCSGGGAYNFYFSNSACGSGYSPVSSTMKARAVRNF
jgi:hypothetical protein